MSSPRGGHKLSNDDCKRLCERRREGASVAQLAEEFGITTANVWPHYKGECKHPYPDSGDPLQARVSDALGQFVDEEGGEVALHARDFAQALDIDINSSQAAEFIRQFRETNQFHIERRNGKATKWIISHADGPKQDTTPKKRGDRRECPLCGDAMDGTPLAHHIRHQCVKNGNDGTTRVTGGGD